MTTIDRLGLMGIRSYGVDEETFIKFYKPLTIILGRNGSGKSTIIEAVKMATTGDLPPNAENGAALIHDPRIHNETETKAKIRLLFTNVRGDQYVVSRHFQLALKKGPRGIGYKTEFKTLDQTVKRMDDGSSASFRCSNLNAMLPDIMRVTKPVLKNVIFVHQEDSLWPLGESAKLKEKFDEIFAATRYTNALETIRKYRKGQNAELKTVNVELLRYEDKVKILEKARAEVDLVKVRNEELRQGEEALKAEIATLADKRKAMTDIATEYDKKRSRLRDLKRDASMIQKNKEGKFKALKPPLPDMDDDAMVKAIADLKAFVDRAVKERRDREQVMESLRSDIEMKRKAQEAHQNQMGKLEEQLKIRDDKASSLEGMKEDFLASEVFAPGTDRDDNAATLPAKSDNLARWTEFLMSMREAAEEHVKAVNKEADEMLDKAAANLNDINLQLKTAKSTSKREGKEMSEKKKKITEIRAELEQLEGADAAIKKAESKLKTVQRIWDEKRENSRVEILKGKSNETRKQISSKKEELRRLRERRKDLSQNQDDQAQYDRCRETEGRRRRRAKGMVEEFAELLLSSISELDDEATSDILELQTSLRDSDPLTEGNADQRQSELLDAARKISARKDMLLKHADRDLSEVKASLKSELHRKAEVKDHFDDASKELRSAEREMREARSSISKIRKTSVNIDSVTRLLEEMSVSSSGGRAQLRRGRIGSIQETIVTAETAVVKANQQISQLESGVLLAEGDLEKFELDPKHRCPACGISSSKKVEDMRQKLKDRVEYFKNPASIQNAEKELKDLECTVKALKKVYDTGSYASAIVERFERAKEKLLEAERTTLQLETEVSNAAARLEKCHEQVGDDTAIGKIDSKSCELAQVFRDWHGAQREVALLHSSLPTIATDTPSLSEVDRKTELLEKEVDHLQNELDEHEKDLKWEVEDLQNHERRVSIATNKCFELRSDVDKHKRLRSEEEELSKTVRTLKSHSEELRRTIKNLDADQENAEAEHATVRAEGKKSLEEAIALEKERMLKLQEWNNDLREVESYDRSRKRLNLENTVKSLEMVQADIESRNRDLRAHENELQTASDSQYKMELQIQNLKNNQEYRDEERSLQVNTRSIRHVLDEIEALERKAEGNPAVMEERLRERMGKKQEDLSATVGTRQVYKEQYKEKKMELDKAEREGSRRKFDECRIQKQTMELASSDLEKYHRALDQALMAFHTLKMNSINRTIKELWQQTYRGTDIEEIEIVSDHGDPRTGAGGTLKRKFNYRVMMRQGQAMLDMRGRCSAGQKVLACLVIRLALAESFCTDCGILALDEPTTNLDKENIDSLADALKSIIESRRKQRNFQLVLITHDQEFIDRLGARAFCDEYFMVFKDSQGISKARVQDLHEM